MDFIRCSNLSYDYVKSDGEQEIKIKALKNISLNVKKGEFVAILGHNGSGKSTFGKILNGLITPDENTVFVDGIDVADSKNIWRIREKVGMVFQNPDNQLISSIVEDEVAFGPENIRIPSEEIRKRVDDALKKVGMYNFKDDTISTLSGGQKQKIAIAGIIAMKPECIIFDEATAMLDPSGRKDVLKIVRELNDEGITIIYVTHNMEESIYAHRIVVFNDGNIAMEGTPKEIFSQYDELIKYHLELPQITELGRRIGIKNVFTAEELASDIVEKGIKPVEFIQKKYENKNETILDIKNLSYTYPNGKIAVDNVSACIKEGELICLIGHTGSGKSTFVQLLNKIYKADKGEIYFKGKNINEINGIRQKIGLVFQYPEDQIFEATVFDEVAFAPKNIGLDKNEIAKRVKNALDFVNIDENYYGKNPLQLSGGEKRKIAIAGILAMEPEVLVLDEPMAGLDPMGRKEILKNIKDMTKKGITVILVSHSMEETAEVADRIIVAYKGKFVFFDTPENVFKNSGQLINIGLDVPQIASVFNIINKKGICLPLAYSIDAAENILMRALSK